MNTLWRGFNAEYPSLEWFRDAEDAQKTEFLRKMGDTINKMAADEFADKNTSTSRGAIPRDSMSLYQQKVETIDPTDSQMPGRINKMASGILRK